MMVMPRSRALWIVRIDTWSSLTPHIHPPIAHVPSAIRVGVSFGPGMAIVSSAISGIVQPSAKAAGREGPPLHTAPAATDVRRRPRYVGSRSLRVKADDSAYRAAPEPDPI